MKKVVACGDKLAPLAAADVAAVVHGACDAVGAAPPAALLLEVPRPTPN